MALTFTCPSGHTISCQERFTGKLAKCPQCSGKFIVPPRGKATADPLPKKESSASSSGKTKKTPVEDEIVFLCPNGHKLNGPARMQGQPGQCPECNTKFRIPSYEDTAEAATPARDNFNIRTGEEVGEDAVFDADDMEEIEIVEDIEITEVPDDFQYADDEATDDMVTEFVPALPDFTEGTHALSGIFALLWQQRLYGGGIEMQLAGGELLSPDFYSSELSQASHGVFATATKDGSYTIVSIPWDSVLRVTLRKTSDLPPGLFEE